MPQDSQGMTWSVSSAVNFDDGHSSDWQHGTVTGIVSIPANSAAIQRDGDSGSLIYPDRWVHVGKPADPPDHT